MTSLKILFYGFGLLFSLSLVGLLIWQWGIAPYVERQRNVKRVFTRTYNGVTVVIPEAEFDKACAKRDGRWIKAPKAFIFGDLEGLAKAYRTGTWLDGLAFLNHCDAVPSEDIYVPFVSQDSFQADAAFFKAPSLENAYKRVTGVRPGEFPSRWQKFLNRFVEKDRADARYLISQKAWLCVCALMSSLAWGGTAAVIYIPILVKEPAAYTTTLSVDNGVTAATVNGTSIQSRPLFMDDRLDGSGRLDSAIVVEQPFYIGGDIVSVRVKFAAPGFTEPEDARASASLHLRPGDHVIIRGGKVRAGGFYYFERWIIKKDEADALINTGQFRLIE